MKTIITEMPERNEYTAGKGTLEVGYPWLTTGAIMALELILTKEFNVLEFGTGGSTIFYATRCKSVTFFETDPEWYSNVGKKLEELNPGNVEAYWLPGTQKIVEFINRLPDERYDLVAIDPDPILADRLTLAMAVLPKVKPEGWLLLDNYSAGTFKDFVIPEGWKTYTFDDFDWSGNGTRLYRKPQ